MGGVENNWGFQTPVGIEHPSADLYSKDLAIPGLNLLVNHPPITRTNSEAVSLTLTTPTAENEEIVDALENSEEINTLTII